MRRLLISTTALSVALSPIGTLPIHAQVLNEDGSVTGPDGSVLCVPTADAACDIDRIIQELDAAAEAQVEADAAAAAAAEAQAAAEAAALEAALAAEAQSQADAEAAEAAAAETAAAEAAAAQAQADAEAALAAQQQAEADAAAAQAAAEAAAAELIEEPVAEEPAPEALAEEPAPEEAAPEELVVEEPAPEAAPEETLTEEAAPAEQIIEEPTLEEALAEEAAREEAATEEAAPEITAPEELVIEEPAVEETVTEEAVTEEAVTEEAVIEEAAPEEAVTEEAAPEIVAPEELVIEDPAPEETAPEEAVTEEAAPEEPVTEEAVTEAAPEDGTVDPATGEVIDPAADQAALEAAEAELAIGDDGELVDPAAGLAVAEPAAEAAEPVDVPVVSEAEVESLTEILTADPTAIAPESIAAAAAALAAPAVEGGEVAPASDSEDLISTVTETITEQQVRTSAQEFAAAPQVVSEGRKSGLSDLEKAGLLVLGALAVGTIIKNNNEAQQERRVVSNTGDRVVVLQPDGSYQVLKDDDAVIRRPGSDVRTETFRDGSTRTIVQRADGTQVVTIRDATGRVLRRATYDDLGRELVLINDLEPEERVVVRDLPRPERRIVISSSDSDAALRRELAALEAERIGRTFSLRQIREIPQVRALAAVIDTQNVTFASGSAAIPPTEARNLADLGRVMQELLDENPGEVFLIEGHTDATGKAAMNLALSDRRAESVALALTEYFDIPPENMVVQGYGETELLIDTQANEPLNRRVEVRVITPLMRTAQLR
jgi:outer membrane protein OmpA-like peptidoglycan-associated protein